MTSFPLRLRPLSTATRQTSAFIIPGADPAAWLEELVRWGIALAKLDLYVLPDGLGLFVPLPGGMTVRETLRAQPYQPRGEALHFPCDARLDPPITEEEADAAAGGRVLVLHPAAGLVAFRAKDAIRVEALLAAPPRREVAWDKANPGIATAPRLLLVEPEEQPTVERVLEEGRDDIGTSSPEELPRAPGERREGKIKKAAKWVGKRLSGMLGKARKPVPNDPNLDGKRAMELARLMRLLASDPDEGLRFALPLRDVGARGAGRPGAQLTPRAVNFDLKHLRGGKPGDPWAISADAVANLRARYRDLATREIRLGRYRRAAYILAELLGDHAGAAATLAQGRHFREAAVLYRDYLKQPLAAARCLEEGGLLSEAIAIYEEERQFLAAGSLYARLDRPEEAEKAFRRAAEALREEGNLLAAARVLEVQVGAPDEALELLGSAWPWSEQAVACLAARFDLLGRLGRHEESLRTVGALRQTSAPQVRASDLVRGLVEVATKYPDEGVRERAADAARVVAGMRLPRADIQETGSLVQDVARLAPEDRLLSRDVQRYHAKRRDQLTARKLPAARKEAPEEVGGFQLPRDVTWKTAASHGNVFYAAGFCEAGPVVARGLWNGTMQRVGWKLAGQGRKAILMSPGLYHRDAMLCCLAGGPRLDLLKLPPTDAIPALTLVGTPHWMPEGVVALSYGGSRHAWILRRGEGGAALSAYSSEGQLLSTHALGVTARRMDDDSTPWDELPPPPLLACASSVFVAMGTVLVTTSPGPSVPVVDAGQWIFGLCSYMPTSHPRIVATCETGGVVLWLGANWGRQRPVGEGLVRPVATFTQDGSLVMLGEREGHVYDTRELRATLVTTFEAPADPPLAVVPAARSNEFAVFGRDGDVRVFRLPKG